MTKFGKTLVGIYVLLFGIALCISCKKKPPELTPRVYELPDLDDEEIEDLPEDNSGQIKE
tara:strand:+ start:3784 stop:3963 length:180 start_codon:yes stop_codon:yes gene_type:complete